jgi:hypothetical protein
MDTAGVLNAHKEEMAGLCTHEHVGWPQFNQQRCVECGSKRSYDPYDLQRGMVGEWMPPEWPDPERGATEKSRPRRASLPSSSLSPFELVMDLAT